MQCTSAFLSQPKLNTSAFATITVKSEALVAQIDGVDRSVAVNLDANLDGSRSYDPDDLDEKMVYLWTVTPADGTFVLTNAATSKATVRFTDAGGPYVATLTISKTDRSSTATSQLRVSADTAAPVLTVVARSTVAKYNPLGIAAFDFTTMPASGRTVVTSWGPAAYLVKAQNAPTPLLLDLGAFEPRQTYLMTLTATDSQGSQSTTSVQVVMNSPPT